VCVCVCVCVCVSVCVLFGLLTYHCIIFNSDSLDFIISARTVARYEASGVPFPAI